MERFAPAKLNLFLHVGPLGADGYHPVCSLMVFADVGDTVRFIPDGEGLAVEGPFGEALSGGADNLVLRARDALLARAGVASAAFGLVLRKALPIAAGLGGGSSDAAATLRLVRDSLGLTVGDEALREIAAGLGSDVPACLDAVPVIATGRGEVLEGAPPLPDLHAVLVNPGVPSPTGAVYRAFDQAPAGPGADRPAWPSGLDSAEAVADFLATCRNDLEAPAVSLTPTIGETLAKIARDPASLIARMSGSGATSFAICAGRAEAEGLAQRLSAAGLPWVRACAIAGTLRA